MSILVVGSVALDTVETPFGRVRDALGGSATYFATAASLYAPVRLVAVVGTDFPDEHVQFLRSRGIDILIIGGIATNVCCETTAREAMQREFRVFFLSDGTATADMGEVPAAELQRASLGTLGFLFAQILTVEEMIEKIGLASLPDSCGRAEVLPTNTQNRATI